MNRRKSAAIASCYPEMGRLGAEYFPQKQVPQITIFGGKQPSPVHSKFFSKSKPEANDPMAQTAENATHFPIETSEKVTSIGEA